MIMTIGSTRHNPCKGCPDRYPACSAHCEKPEYKAYRAEQETIKRNRQAYNDSWAYTTEAVMKNRRPK
jgi:hypothetical protein